MQCPHCFERFDQERASGARCPECGGELLMFTAGPASSGTRNSFTAGQASSGGPSFDEVVSKEIHAPDLAAIDQLIVRLHQPTEDPFQFPIREPQPVRPAPPVREREYRPLRIPKNSIADKSTGDPGQLGSAIGWTFLGLGLMAFTCGAVMLGWSAVTSRDELWTLGMPLALGGQAAIVFGLIGLLESSSARQAKMAASLEEHREQLANLQEREQYSRAA